MVIIEAPLFSRLVYDYLSDDEYAALQWALTLHPEMGPIIQGKGKRGGLRIIYYWKSKSGEIWLLTLYAKNEAADIPRHLLKMLQQEIDS
jgi:hypothetical protein